MRMSIMTGHFTDETDMVKFIHEKDLMSEQKCKTKDMGRNSWEWMADVETNQIVVRNMLKDVEMLRTWQWGSILPLT